MTETNFLHGMTTVVFFADDVKAARQWYSNLLGLDAYFQRPDAETPSYVEFRLGDYQHELGIVDRRYAPKTAMPGPGGAILYWSVDDVPAALEKLISLGATAYEPVTKRGEGFITGAVVDPFGNVLGVMFNQHYRDILAAMKNG